MSGAESLNNLDETSGDCSNWRDFIVRPAIAVPRNLNLRSLIVHIFDRILPPEKRPCQTQFLMSLARNRLETEIRGKNAQLSCSGSK